MKIDIAQVWRTYGIQRALASEYVQPYRVGVVLGGMGARNPLLEELLPSMLFVRLMSVLDEALQEHMNTTRLRLPAKMQESLHNRITFLKLSNEAVLLKHKGTRNELGHGTKKSVTWTQLDGAIADVHSALENLGFVASLPKYSVTTTQSQMREGGARDYSMQVAEGEKVVAEIKWTTTIHESNAE